MDHYWWYALLWYAVGLFSGLYQVYNVDYNKITVSGLIAGLILGLLGPFTLLAVISVNYRWDKILDFVLYDGNNYDT